MPPHRAEGDVEVSRQPWPPPLATPEPVSTDLAACESAAPSSAFSSSAAEIAQGMVRLLAEMEASLEGSQKAVLASDGLELENCTREQVRLHRALEVLLWPRAWPGTAVEKGNPEGNPEDAQKKNVGGVGSSVPQFFAYCAPPLAAELLAAERRVLHATRVQAELLRRARRFQRILANVAAAQGAPYGAWFGSGAQL